MHQRLMEPKNAAAIPNGMYYATMNQAALPYVAPAIRNDPSIFLSAADRHKLAPPGLPNLDISRLVNRLYTRFRTGL